MFMHSLNECLVNKKGVLKMKLLFHFVAFLVSILCSIVGYKICTVTAIEYTHLTAIDNLHRFWLGYGTIWSFSFQTIFLSLALAYDVLEWLNKHETSIGTKIRYWRDIVFTALVVPFTCFVTGMFWSVYTIDRELVFPMVYDAIVPWWFNHCVHTNIAVVVVLETLLQPRRKPVNFKLELLINTSVSVLYAVVYYSIYFFAHRWLYGVFGVMTWWQVCLFQLFIWASVFFFYWIQYPINRMIHGSEPEMDVKEVAKEHKDYKEDERITEKTNGIVQTESYEDRNGSVKNPDLLSAPFATKSWSLKYRLIREQFENSRL
ncbi:androgen-dependent TFPI-regulating protein-like isoform X2 [Amyelois transitella]|uniref:androgen-dependent TFPI-regulating protein-like isoform X2 n=1 Tax=Amyelois transitella TaxID=680683 RepID=UPI00299010F1|nr:androgen-dependent TFPI-regulating protein-like isoform X2 [Amyelois transitella]